MLAFLRRWHILDIKPSGFILLYICYIMKDFFTKCNEFSGYLNKKCLSNYSLKTAGIKQVFPLLV